MTQEAANQLGLYADMDDTLKTAETRHPTRNTGTVAWATCNGWTGPRWD